MLILISWIGNIFIVTGLWFIGAKKRWAWYFSMAGEALWIIFFRTVTFMVAGLHLLRVSSDGDSELD